MPHQDLIDYQNLVKTNNLASIDAINQTMVTINDMIAQANTNIANYNTQLTNYAQTITNLQNFNTLIDETIDILSQP